MRHHLRFDTFCLIVRFLRQAPSMLRLAFLLALAVSACSGEQEDNAEGDPVPIGPGSDTTVLIPPDTPVTPNPLGRDTPTTSR
jgi:hypothetical protein